MAIPSRNYDFSNLSSNQTTVVDWAVFVNQNTNYIWVGGLLIALFFIQIAVLSKLPNSNLTGSMTFSAWLCFVYSVILQLAGNGLINFWFSLSFLMVAALGTWYLAWSKT